MAGLIRCVHNLIKPGQNPDIPCCHLCSPPPPREPYIPGKILPTDGINPELLDRKINKIATSFIGTYNMTDFKVTGPNATKYSRDQMSDNKADMVQSAYVEILVAQEQQPEKMKDKEYFNRVVVSSLSRYERKSRTRRHKTDNIIDEPLITEDGRVHNPALQLAAPDAYAASEAAADVQRLIQLADLTPSEQLCIELKYGFGEGSEFGPCTISKIGQLTDRSETWVRGRIYAAELKLQVASEPS